MKARTQARQRADVPPPLLLALASAVMEGSESSRGAANADVTAAYATVTRLIQRGGVPFERDEVIEAAKQSGHRSCYVKDARHEYDLSTDALDLASVGYVEAGGLNLGMALMFCLLQDRGGVR